MFIHTLLENIPFAVAACLLADPIDSAFAFIELRVFAAVRGVKVTR
ncbi:hypothetical protein [Paraburkholderia hospita]|nr:hypothetical protein [Paraburkholderia hospita]SEH45412.1 hypothetical protein SAMN05192544_100238 [Paraburkholderia hospita]